MASKPAMALYPTTITRQATSAFFGSFVPFSVVITLMACVLAFTDRWCPLPVATEELASVMILLLLPLACNHYFRKPRSSAGCQKDVVAKESVDFEAAEIEETSRSQESTEAEGFIADVAPQRVATASLDGTVALWGFASGQGELKLEEHTGALSAVSFSADGKVVVTAACDGTARIWDAETGACRHIFDDGGGAVCSVALSLCGGLLLTGLDDYCAQLWRVPSCKDEAPTFPELILEGHTSTVASVAFSPSGEIAATGSWDGTARLWNVASGTCEHTLEGHDAEVFAVTFSPLGGTLATASQDGTARIWSVHSGWCLMSLDSHENAVRSAVFSPCGRLLATGCWDGSVRLWDVGTGLCQMTLSNDLGSPIHSIAFSANGSTLAIVDGNTVRLCSAVDGQCIKILNGHTDTVQSVSIYP